MAGSFYPKNPDELINLVDHYILSAQSIPLSGKPIGFIVPHAGYIFSGPVAGYVYKILNHKDITHVVIIGLAHRFALKGAAVISEGMFRTPLGDIPVDRTTVQKLLARSPYIEDIPAAHEGEHSIEVQLPFLQRTLTAFSIIPILIGNPSLAVCEEIGAAVADSIDRDATALLASTDLSHYPAYHTAIMVDREMINALKTFDPAALNKTVNNLMQKNIPDLHCVLCGEGAVYTLMFACKKLGADTVEILKYANSGDTAGSKEQVVGYLAAAFTAGKKKEGSLMNEEIKSQAENNEAFTIKPENRKILLQIARKSIAAYLKEKKLAQVSARDDRELGEHAAVFVTLTKDGSLRGCIGTTEARYPLIDAVNQLAVSAACQDYRFPPVTSDELQKIRIEISVLSPLQKISSHQEIEPGKHGVVIAKGECSGLFLPQVWEHFPQDKDGFLGELCSQKAGLPRDAWKKDRDINLFIFTVFSFEESEKE